MASKTNTPAIGGTVLPRDIVIEIEDDFINYSMSVIMQRALPDARDGLKPVQRRILRAMADQHLWPGNKYKKSATVVGDVLGKYHPHGDSSVYDAMVRLAQGHAMHEPLIDGQGNFGTIDDPAAAYRYTEARMTGVAEIMLRDIDRQTVDMSANFDGRLKEPVVLPAGLPNLLLNGSEGIAVGMATKIPPHNLRELVGALELLLDNPDVDDKTLLAKVKGPDFPTGGFLLASSEIKELYNSGRGKMVLRARCSVEKVASGRMGIIVSELPYAVSPERLATTIQTLVKDNAMVPGANISWADAIAALRNESDRDGLRVVIEVRKDVDPATVLGGLYQKTDLQTTYSAQMIALVNKRPTYLGLRRALEVYVGHRVDVIVRRTKFDLDKAEARAHIIDGLLIAIGAIDKVVAILKTSKDRGMAKATLMKTFKLSDIQGDAILSMRLAQLTSLDVSELKREHGELLKTIAMLKKILASPVRQREVIKEELLDAAQPLFRPRRTEILNDKTSGAVGRNSAVAPAAVTLSESTTDVALYSDGTIRSGAKLRGDIVQRATVKATEHLVVVTSTGRAWPLTMARLAGVGRGAPLSALLGAVDASERIVSIISPEEQGRSEASLVFVYTNGKVKRLDLGEAIDPKSTGTGVVKLNDGDELIACLVVDNSEDVLLVSSTGKCLRLSVAEIPVQGRAANGVAGIKSDGKVISAIIIGKKSAGVAVLTERGMGKIVPADDFPVQGRGSQGVWALRTTDKTGKLVWSDTLDGRVVAVGEETRGGKDFAKGDRAMVVKPVKGLSSVEGARTVLES